MPLANGIYQIRFVPPHIHLPFLGGVYATGEEVNAPILAHAINPEIPGEQNWRVEAVQGKPNTYLITYPGFAKPSITTGPGPVIPGFGLKPNPGYNELIRLTFEITEWVITEVNAKFGVYRISEPTELVGAVHSITEEDGRLVLKSYPVIPDVIVPTWQFVSA